MTPAEKLSVTTSQCATSSKRERRPLPACRRSSRMLRLPWLYWLKYPARPGPGWIVGERRHQPRDARRPRGRLDADHLGAEVGEVLRAERPRPHRVKSSTRMPASGPRRGAHRFRARGHRVARRRRGPQTSSVCSPSRGAGRRSDQCIVPYCDGAPGRSSCPTPGCSNVTKNLRSRRCSFSYICPCVLIGANGIRRPCASR